MFDGKAFGREIVEAVKAHMERATAPLIKRIDDLERELTARPKEVSEDAVRALIADEIVKHIAPMGAAIKAWQPAPELPDIGKMIDDAFSARLDVEDMEKSIEEVVRQVVAEIPVPQDGKSVTIADVAPVIAEEIRKQVSALPLPKDGENGIGVAGAFIDRGGNLVVTLSNGEAKNLGPIVGKDGDPGVDGIGFDDMSVAYDGERTMTLRFAKGEQTKEFTFDIPVVLDRGVYREGSEYKTGDGVTWAGSFWICQGDTSEKPDSGKGWRLAVKKGRDGKDAGTLKREG